VVDERIALPAVRDRVVVTTNPMLRELVPTRAGAVRMSPGKWASSMACASGTAHAFSTVVVKTRAMWVVGLAMPAVILGWMYYASTRATPAPTIATAPVTRGDVVEVVDATGTVQAVTTVQVGTQVSGTIKSLRADFNSRVRRGQVVAELEPSLFETQVEQARASLMRLEAEVRRADVQLDDAHQKLARAKALSAQQLVPATDLETASVNVRMAQAALQAAQAQVVQAQASLHQSEVNLAHTIITAPIDGIVISRNVDVGQTVAASMQAPTLFVIARDLHEMQVEASVAESDIGRLQPGQSVTFHVDAYPTETFVGAVTQIRLQPVIEQNVVSYTTIIDVPNPDLHLKPGMTANVTVEIARAVNVLRVPNAALRVHPSADLLAALPQPLSVCETTPPPGRRDRDVTDRDHASIGTPAEVWVLVDGRLSCVPVRTSITDGTRTAVVSSGLGEATMVVTSISGGESVVPSSNTSPLLPSFRGRGPGGARGTGAVPPGRK
jgi:HlyD family secretion protein